MKKLVLLSFATCMLLTSNTFGMLRAVKRTIPTRILMQKRNHVGAQPRKNIFNINTDLEPRDVINGHMQDLCDRNSNIEKMLFQQKELSDKITKILKDQNRIAIQDVFHGGSLRIKSLKSGEEDLKELIQAHSAIGSHIQLKASCLETKARGHADE